MYFLRKLSEAVPATASTAVRSISGGVFSALFILVIVAYWYSYQYFKELNKTSAKTEETRQLETINLIGFIFALCSGVIPGVPGLFLLGFVLASYWINYQYFLKQSKDVHDLKNLFLALFIVVLLCIPTKLTFWVVPFACLGLFVLTPIFYSAMLKMYEEKLALSPGDANLDSLVKVYKGLYITSLILASLVGLLMIVGIAYLVSNKGILQIPRFGKNIFESKSFS